MCAADYGQTPAIDWRYCDLKLDRLNDALGRGAAECGE
jgi:hypothetical protein